MNGNMTAPVREGEELDVTIEAIGDKGDGIAKKDGFVLVVPNTQVNETVRVKVTKVLRKVGFAEVVGQAEAAPEEPQPEEQEEEDLEPEDEETPEEEPAEDSEDFGEHLEE